MSKVCKFCYRLFEFDPKIRANPKYCNQACYKSSLKNKLCKSSRSIITYETCELVASLIISSFIVIFIILIIQGSF